MLRFEYRFSKSYRIRVLLGGLFCLVAPIFSSDLDRTEWIPGTIICLLFSGYSFWLYRYTRSYSIVGEDALTWVSPDGSTVSIRWDEITEIKIDAFRRRTDVTSANVRKAIRIDHRLDGYLELQGEIWKRVPSLYEDMDAFHISSLLRVAGPMTAALALIILVGSLAVHHGRLLQHDGLIIAIGLVALMMPLSEMRSITIGRHLVWIRFPLRTQTIRVKDISSVDCKVVVDDDTPSEVAGAVVITMTSGRQIKIRSVKEGNELLYARLCTAVERAGQSKAN